MGDSRGRLRAIRRLRTAPGASAPAIAAAVVMALRGCCDELGMTAPAAAGVGFGGPVDYARGQILRSHHVSAWDGYPLRAELAAALGCPVTLENDANAGALGEARFGAGRGHRHLVYVNVGTGIGAGLVL
ncbi:MAG TPA: ROK family protein, partial [Chloroflexota bacterium]|nr:ROK family protein [Chloroflexota bacterium]